MNIEEELGVISKRVDSIHYMMSIVSMNIENMVKKSDLENALTLHKEEIKADIKQTIETSISKGVVNQTQCNKDIPSIMLYNDETSHSDVSPSISLEVKQDFSAERAHTNIGVKRHFRQKSLGYEADQDSDSGLWSHTSSISLTDSTRKQRISNHKYPKADQDVDTGLFPKCSHNSSKENTRKHKFSNSKLSENSRLSGHDQSTLTDSGENTDTLIENTMARMEAEGTLSIDTIFDTVKSMADEMDDSENSREVSKDKQSFLMEEDGSLTGQRSMDKQDLQTDGCLTQLDRERKIDLTKVCKETATNPTPDACGNSSDGSDFEKQSATLNLQGLWTSLRDKNVSDEGYHSFKSFGLQQTTLTKTDDDDTETDDDVSYDNLKHQHNQLRKDVIVESTNPLQMAPRQLLLSAGLSPTTILEDIISLALKDEVKGNVRDGIDTLLLWDVSGSTAGKIFYQIKASVISLITSIDSATEENIGIVTIGRDTKILHHLTNDYSGLLEAIETVEGPAGTTPLTLGLLLCHIEIQNRGGPTSIAGYRVCPRIIIISDGRPTEDVLLYDEALESGRKDPLIKERVIRYAAELQSYGYQISCISVGASANKEFLMNIAQVSQGTVCEMDSMDILFKHFLRQKIIGRTIAICKETGKEDNYEAVARKEQMLHGNLDDTDIKIIIEGIEKSEELIDREDPDLPPLGSRVLEYDDHSSLGASLPESFEGTVTNHKQSGIFKVLWDISGSTTIHSKYSVDIKELIRIDKPREPPSVGMIAPGVRVVQEDSYQKGKSPKTGRVFEVTDSGRFKVRWSDGEIIPYSFEDLGVGGLKVI